MPRVKRTIKKLGRKGVNWMSCPDWDHVVGCCQHGNERLSQKANQQSPIQQMRLIQRNLQIPKHKST